MFRREDNEFMMFGGRGNHGFGPGFRAGRGMMEPAILTALLEKPMHGYEIITTLSEKSHGIWKPSAGSVYPTLQLLEEKDHVTGKEVDGKKVYELTKVGRQAAEDSANHLKGFWNGHHNVQSVREFHASIKENMMMIRKIYRKGNDEQRQQLQQALDEFGQSLRTIFEGGTA